MYYIVLNGVKPYDGRYEFDFSSAFNTHEWGWIKRHSGYLPLTVEEGFAGGDPELFTVFAVIALARAGRIQPAEVKDVYDRLADAPFGDTIQLEDDAEPEEQEADAGPPARSSNGNEPSSGAGSKMSSANSTENPPNASGMLASVTSGSAPPTSGT